MSLSTSKECRTLVFIIIGFCSIGILAITPQHRAEASTFKTLGDTSTLMSQIVQTASENIIDEQIQSDTLLQQIVSHSFSQANAFSYVWTIKNNPTFTEVPLKKLVPLSIGETGEMKISVPDNFLMRDYSADRVSQGENSQGGFDILVYGKNQLFYEGTKLMAVNQLSGEKQSIATLMADAVKTQNATDVSYGAFKFTSGFFHGSKSRPVTIVEANVTSKLTPTLQHYWRVYLYVPEIDSVISMQLISDPESRGKQDKIWKALLKSILKKSSADTTTKSTKAKNVSKYQNDLFSITLPSGWVREDGMSQIKAKSLEGNGSMLIKTEFSELVDYKHTHFDLLVDQFKREFKSGGFLVTRGHKTSLDGMPAILLDLEAKINGVSLKGQLITTVKDSDAYILNGVSEKSLWKTYQKIIEKSFKTFKFKD